MMNQLESIDDAEIEEEQVMIDEAMSESLPLLKSLTESGITPEQAMNILREYADQLDWADEAAEEMIE